MAPRHESLTVCAESIAARWRSTAAIHVRSLVVDVATELYEFESLRDPVEAAEPNVMNGRLTMADRRMAGLSMRPDEIEVRARFFSPEGAGFQRLQKFSMDDFESAGQELGYAYFEDRTRLTDSRRVSRYGAYDFMCLERAPEGTRPVADLPGRMWPISLEETDHHTHRGRTALSLWNRRLSRGERAFVKPT